MIQANFDFVAALVVGIIAIISAISKAKKKEAQEKNKRPTPQRTSEPSLDDIFAQVFRSTPVKVAAPPKVQQTSGVHHSDMNIGMSTQDLQKQRESESVRLKDVNVSLGDATARLGDINVDLGDPNVELKNLSDASEPELVDFSDQRMRLAPVKHAIVMSEILSPPVSRTGGRARSIYWTSREIEK